MPASPNKERIAHRPPMRPTAVDESATAPACVVVGASVRAFAESAWRRGWRVHAADLFADRDLAAVATSLVRLGPAGVAAYPRGIPEVVAALPDGPCIYTGALENHPEIVAALAARRPLAGCSADALCAVRDPRRLATLAERCGEVFPDTRFSPAGLPTDGTYLVKPLRSAGGHGVRPWCGDSPPGDANGHVWQRLVKGTHWSTSYLACRGVAHLVGVSRPLAPARWGGGCGITYAGSIDVPVEQVPDAVRHRFETLGAAIAGDGGLTGLFGIDTIVDGFHRIHVLEVNPRPTASMELLERASGWSMAAAHLAAFGWEAMPSTRGHSGVVWAKAIAFAPRTRHPAADDVLAALAERWTAHDGMAALADVPASDQWPAAGGPLVTLFAAGESESAARATLRRRMLTLRRAVGHGLNRRGGAAS